jgi:hypothetical protein
MAVKSITLVRQPDISRNHITRRIAIQVTGNYAAPEVIDLTTIVNTAKWPQGKPTNVAGSVAALPPTDNCEFVTGPDGYSFRLIQNAAAPTLKNYQLYVYSSGDTALAGAYPANVLGQDIVFDISQGNKRG